MPVAGDESMQLAKELARKEGIFVGTSAGATLAAALAVARRAKPGANIVCMLPDTAERYLSTPLFDDIGEEMDDEELALSRSTPGYRFDPPAASCRKARERRHRARPRRGRRSVRQRRRPEQPGGAVRAGVVRVLLVGRKLFARLGIEYESVDLDSVAYQDGDRGGKIRAVLKDRIGSPTIPQIYVGGEHIGGCTELLDEMRAGTLQQRLTACGADFDEAADFDPTTAAEVAALEEIGVMSRPQQARADGLRPVIDIADLMSRRPLQAIDRACREWGFFQVTGHGLGADAVSDLFATAAAVLRPAGRDQAADPAHRRQPLGLLRRRADRQHARSEAGFRLRPARRRALVPQWPAGMPQFEAAVRAYYDACENIAHRLLGAISVNLGMPADYLSRDFTESHTSFMRINFYPKDPADAPPSASDKPFGVHQHTDAGALTLLMQDGQPGLEICRDGVWHLVEPLSGALVINIGDIVQVWSNDRYRAALHRVVTSPDRDRYSAPYFFNPGFETTYAPLPTTVTAATPAALPADQLARVPLVTRRRRLRRPWR